MRSVLILIIGFIFSSTDSVVNWFVDNNTVPELLPELMRNEYSNEEIQNAVFRAYKIQYDVISEHNGHVFDVESPLGFFNDSLILAKTTISLINSDVIYENNMIYGLPNYKSNEVVIKWSQDRVSTKITWNELKIIGNYKFLDDRHYINDKYEIVVNDVTYEADIPLSKHAELYPSSVQKAVLSYTNFKTAFIVNHLILNKFSTTQYFLEKIVFRQVADYVMEVSQKNVTWVIRMAVKPYVVFKNYSDPHFPDVIGWLDDGREFSVNKSFVSGLDNVVQKVKAVSAWLEQDFSTVIIFIESTLHNISGSFDLHVLGTARQADSNKNGLMRHTAIAVDFTINRIVLSITYDVLRPNCYCSTVVQIYGISARSKNTEDHKLQQKIVTTFVDSIREHLSVGMCAAIVKINKNGNNSFCPFLL